MVYLWGGFHGLRWCHKVVHSPYRRLPVVVHKVGVSRGCPEGSWVARMESFGQMWGKQHGRVYSFDLPRSSGRTEF